VVTIGIDIGGRAHVAARCRDGQARADREILRVSQSRAGFTALDAWFGRQAEPVTWTMPTFRPIVISCSSAVPESLARSRECLHECEQLMSLSIGYS
jgi:hypothetical protein